MSDTHTIPLSERPAMDGVIAYLILDGCDAAGELYQRALGAEIVNRMPAEDGKRLIHLCLRINNGYLMFSDPFPEHGHAVEKPQGYVLHLQVDDIEAWFKRAVDAGFEAVMAPADMFWGDRYGQLRDRWGVMWSMGQTLSKA